MTERRLPPTWHQALAFAVTGQRLDGHGRQDRPDLPDLASSLVELQSVGQVVLATSAAQYYRVPADLLTGIGPAQFWAVQAELAAILHRTQPRRQPPPIVTDRPLTPEERRLAENTPPHHGS